MVPSSQHTTRLGLLTVKISCQYCHFSHTFPQLKAAAQALWQPKHSITQTLLIHQESLSRDKVDKLRRCWYHLLGPTPRANDTVEQRKGCVRVNKKKFSVWSKLMFQMEIDTFEILFSKSESRYQESKSRKNFSGISFRYQQLMW